MGWQAQAKLENATLRLYPSPNPTLPQFSSSLLYLELGAGRKSHAALQKIMLVIPWLSDKLHSADTRAADSALKLLAVWLRFLQLFMIAVSDGVGTIPETPSQFDRMTCCTRIP